MMKFITGYLWGIIEGIFLASMFAWFVSVINNMGCINPAFESLKWTPEKQEAADKVLDLFGFVSSITFWTGLVTLVGRWLYRLSRGINKFLGKVQQ
jgi:hypothetical protein